MPDFLFFMQKYIDDVKTWMTVIKLKLIDDKTEALAVSSGRKKIFFFSYLDSMIAGIPLSDTVHTQNNNNKKKKKKKKKKKTTTTTTTQI